MIVLDEQQKREALNQLLYDLAKGQDVLKESRSRAEFFIKLEDIYHKVNDDNFRHYYSDIYACLTMIDGNPEMGNIDILATNMQIIKDGYTGGKNKDVNGNPIDVSKAIVKLYDHINLDIGRLNYTKRITSDTQAELSKTKLLIEQLQKQLEESKEFSEEANQSFKDKSEQLSLEIQEGQKKMQNEYITILGIFAAIVLSFTGGMMFTSSVLENMHKSSIYRVVFITLVIGCILYNLIWLLIDFIRNVNEKTIRKMWMFWAFNALFVGMLLFTGFAYKYDWFSREEVINQSVVESNSQETDKIEIPVDTTEEVNPNE